MQSIYERLLINKIIAPVIHYQIILTDNFKGCSAKCSLDSWRENIKNSIWLTNNGVDTASYRLCEEVFLGMLPQFVADGDSLN